MAARTKANFGAEVAVSRIRPGYRVLHWLVSEPVLATALFAGSLGLYQAGGDFWPINDTKPNVRLAVGLLERGSLSFTPDTTPSLYLWKLSMPTGPRYLEVHRWSDRIEARSAGELRAAGLLVPDRPHYYLASSVKEGQAVSMFGPGAGLAALPVFALLKQWVPDVADHPRVLWYGGKLAASIYVAGSVTLVFLAGCQLTSRLTAFIIAVIYATGTGVWSTSSQALLQHGPNTFFLALGSLAYLRIPAGRFWATLSGLAYSAAVCIRPTSALVFLAVAVFLWRTERRMLVPYLLGAAPLLALLAAFNTFYLGAPWRFGQIEAGRLIAQQKTGSTTIWQSPLYLGIPGLLVSPSRGLFVYSPFLLFALWGFRDAWKLDRYLALRPLAVAIVAVWCLESLHFDWWGGWSFGYRHIVDTVPLLVLFLAPVMEKVHRHKVLLSLFSLLVAWSVLVQVLGAYTFNMRDWNVKSAYEMKLPDRDAVVRTADPLEAARIQVRHGVEAHIVQQDIDRPEYRSRLWSITDSQIVHYLSHFSKARERKQRLMALSLERF